MKIKLSRQIINMSKYAMVGVFIQCLLVGVLWASNTNAQLKTVDEIRLSINAQNKSLEDAFLMIGEITQFNFHYNIKTQSKQRINLNMENVTLGDLLRHISRETGLRFKRIQETIHVLPMEGAKERVEDVLTESSQTRVISGKVISMEDDEPLPGVNVLIKGSSQGTITDMNGEYQLQVPSEGITLVFSFVGFTSEEIIADAQTVINVTLVPDVKSLEEIVVVGYGEQKKINLTGAVATVDAEEINKRPVATAAAALQGADPAVNLTFNTGVMDSGYKIDIRGVASINGGSPLIIADGIEVNLNQINPNDIESISVLKDASSAAIYGAKASSGVVLITTKQGKDTGGKANIAYNGRMGWSGNTTSTDFINTGYDHVKTVNMFYESYQGKQMALYNEEEMQMLYERRNDRTEHPDRPWTVLAENGRYYYYGNFDWHDHFYRDSRPQQEHNVSLTGGNNKVNYFVSGRYLDQDGIFKIYEDNYKSYSFRAKLGAELNPWLRYTGNVNYTNSAYDYAGYYNEQQTIHALQSNMLSSFVPFNPDGTIMQYPNQLNANSPIGAGHGGFLTANQARNTRENKYVVLSNQFDAKATNDLTLTASYAFKFHNRPYKYRNMPFEYSREFEKTLLFTSGTIYDYYQENHYNVNNHNLNVYATFNRTFNNRHNLKAVAGTQFEDYRSTSLSIKKTDLLSKDLSSFSVATGEATINQSISAFRTLGVFGRVNYDYEGRYLLELSGRWDGTSRFAPEDRWGFFPSASAGWRISEENFWDPLRSLWNDSKIRLSYGSLGNQQVSNYSYFDKISSDNSMSYTFDGVNTANYSSVSNPISSSLTWETVTMYDLGFDLGFLDNRLNVTSDFYIRDTKDMLTPSLTLPSVYGASTPMSNSADLRTKGWEVYLGWNDEFKVMNKPFNYNVSFSIGDYKAEITRYHNPDKLISDYYEGMTLGEIWGYKVAGLFASDEDARRYQENINDMAVNNRVYTSKTDNYLRAGDVEFMDLNDDQKVNEGSGTVDDPGDKRIIGNSLPRYSYSFRLGASWNGFDVSAFFQGVGKQDWYPTTYAYDFWGPYSFPSLSFIHKDFLSNYWSEENPGAYFPRPRGYASYSAGALGVVNDRYLQDVSYLRLKNLTIGYTVPVNKSLFNQVRIYGTAENPFYWSALKKHSKTVDPELTNTTSTYNSGSGVGYTYSRSFSVGVDITF